MTRVVTIVLLLFIFWEGKTQKSIKYIVDLKSKEAIYDALVFQEGTSNFTVSDVNGSVSFLPISVGSGQVTVSHINFKDATFDSESWSKLDTIFLKIDPVLIDEVIVNAQKSKKRKQWVKSFEKGLLGETKNRKKTKILNINDVLFTEDDNGKVVAVAQNLIHIENKALGYNIKFLLEQYIHYPDGKVSFKGKPIFSQLPYKKEKDLKKWEEARRKTFEKSIRFVLKNLAAGKKVENLNFSIAELINNREFRSMGTAEIENFLLQKNNHYELKITRFLAVENKNIKIPKRRMSNQSITGVSRPAEKEMAMHTQGELEFSSDFATTFLYSRSRSIIFDGEGVILNPEHVSMYGYHGTWGLADMVPHDYDFKFHPFINE